jgi:hypothetical protein
MGLVGFYLFGKVVEFLGFFVVEVGVGVWVGIFFIRCCFDLDRIFLFGFFMCCVNVIFIWKLIDFFFIINHYIC